MSSSPSGRMKIGDFLLRRLALAPILSSSNKGAELDYGPRGPQSPDNQLRSAT